MKSFKTKREYPGNTLKAGKSWLIYFFVSLIAFSCQHNPALTTTQDLPSSSKLDLDSSWARDPSCQLRHEALYDIGSGSTKVSVLQVSSCGGPVVSLLRDSRKVDYKKDLEDQPFFSPAIQKQGLQALVDLKKIAEGHQPMRHRGVATAAFRQAQNGALFLSELGKGAGIELELISQDREAELGFKATQSYLGEEHAQAVIDIGGGSFQVTYPLVGAPSQLKILHGHIASVSFLQVLKFQILKLPPEHQGPYTLTAKQLNQAQWWLRNELNRQKVKPLPISKRKKIYGIGGVFNKSLFSVINKKIMTIEDLDLWLKDKRHLVTFTNNAYAETIVSNVILVRELLNALKVNELHILDVDLVQGLLDLSPNPSRIGN